MTDSVVRHAPLVSIEDEHAPEVPEVGTWWWVLDKKRWLGCVTAVGSNYVELTGVSHKKYYSPPQVRVHLDKVSEELRHEPEAEKIIGEQVERHRSLANHLMEEVRALTGRLGISIGALPEVAGSETQAIALRSGTEPIERYKTALEKAKKETLPKLFERIGEENEAMARWMTANLLPLQSRVSQLKPAIKKIEDQIFRVELYAGLVEEVEKIADGEPADLSEPVHLFQRRAYMDEECLVAYQAGGMHFKDIGAFDRWICEPANRDRLLPFKRCILAFKVRRFLGDIDDVPNMRDYISMWYERELDKLTFLYIRNGDQVHRLRTAIEFGADLFPDLSRIEAEGQLWAKFDGSTIKYLGSEDEYVEWMGYKDRCEAWEREGRDYSKYPGHCDRSIRWERYSPDNVYYDDIESFVHEELARHNRLVLVLQGLLDRSPVLHPHPPWQLWTTEGFAAGLRLIYDSSRSLTTGEAPNFEAYRARLNRSLRTGCMTVGQEDFWEVREAELENERRRNDYRWRDYDKNLKRFRPHGDPGPGRVARVENYRPGAKTCTYRWEKPKMADRGWSNRIKPLSAPTPKAITVPASEILNVSAYKPGDFHVFFDDPRTRADYLKWAPLMLAAEEWHAGNARGVPRPPGAEADRPDWLVIDEDEDETVSGEEQPTES